MSSRVRSGALEAADRSVRVSVRRGRCSLARCRSASGPATAAPKYRSRPRNRRASGDVRSLSRMTDRRQQVDARPAMPQLHSFPPLPPPKAVYGILDKGLPWSTVSPRRAAARKTESSTTDYRPCRCAGTIPGDKMPDTIGWGTSTRGGPRRDCREISNSGLGSFEKERKGWGGPHNSTLSTYLNSRFSGLRCGLVQNSTHDPSSGGAWLPSRWRGVALAL